MTQLDSQIIAQTELEIYVDNGRNAIILDSLLDKPFDQLTVYEWEQLKNYEIPEQNSGSQIEAILASVEVDVVSDSDFGDSYRLRRGTQMLGTFYRKIFTDEWVARPFNTSDAFYCQSEEDAKYYLVQAAIATLIASGIASTQDCINTVDLLASAQTELNEYLVVQAQVVASEIELDSVPDQDFGNLYRVWLACHLLGTFYRALDGSWVTRHIKSNRELRCTTSLEAQMAIIALNGMPDQVGTAVAIAQSEVNIRLCQADFAA